MSGHMGGRLDGPALALAAGGTIGAGAIHSGADAWEASTLPAAHATRAQVFCIDDDLAIVPGSGGDGGLRIYDPDNLASYIRFYCIGGNAYFTAPAALFYLNGTMTLDGAVQTAGWLRLAAAAAIGGPLAGYAYLTARSESGTMASHVEFSTNDVRFAKDIAPVAFTQTYSTTAATHAAMTWTTIGAFTGGVVGFLDAAERDNVRTQINALAADVINLKGVVNLLLDALQAQTSYIS